MKKHLLIVGLLIAVLFSAGEGSLLAASAPKPISAKKFDALANAALAAMKKRAAELKSGGVAVVSYAPGDSVQGWSSKMAVVGRMTDAASAGNNGNNLLGIAYAKSAEMAETLQDSGTAKRKPMTGNSAGREAWLPMARPDGSLLPSAGENRRTMWKSLALALKC